MSKAHKILNIVLFVELIIAVLLTAIPFYLCFVGVLPLERSLVYIIIWVCLYALATHYYDYSAKKQIMKNGRIEN